MKLSSPRLRWRFLVFAALLLAVGAVAFHRLHVHLRQGQFPGALNNARQLQIAAQQMALDLRGAGEGDSGYPADLGVKSLREYGARIVRENYLSAADFARISRRVEVANVSRHDPPDTAFVLARSSGGGFFVMTLGGSGGVYKRATDPPKLPPHNPTKGYTASPSFVTDAPKLPPRAPAILPP